MRRSLIHGDKKHPRKTRGPEVYENVKDLVRRGELGPHNSISENEIARRLNVSRTPVREALLRLTSEGWLVEREGKSPAVRTLSQPEVSEIYILRETLEGAAARLAARSASRPELLALKEVARNFEEAVSRGASPEELDQINVRFHSLLHRSSNSHILSRILEPLQLSTRQLPQSLYTQPSHAEESAKEHIAIVNALMSRNELQAEAAARTHVSRAREVRETMTVQILASQ